MPEWIFVLRSAKGHTANDIVTIKYRVCVCVRCHYCHRHRCRRRRRRGNGDWQTPTQNDENIYKPQLAKQIQKVASAAKQPQRD